MLSKGFLELARKLIAADTVSSQGTQRAADLLQSLWEHAGLTVRKQVVEEVHVDLLGGPGGGAQGPGGVLLVTHLDTVPPGPRERWQTDPWTLTERDGFLHGLGVADVKLDALCKAEAARRLQGRSARRRSGSWARLAKRWGCAARGISRRAICFARSRRRRCCAASRASCRSSPPTRDTRWRAVPSATARRVQSIPTAQAWSSCSSPGKRRTAPRRTWGTTRSSKPLPGSSRRVRRWWPPGAVLGPTSFRRAARSRCPRRARRANPSPRRRPSCRRAPRSPTCGGPSPPPRRWRK